MGLGRTYTFPYYLNSGNYRYFNVSQGNTITLAHPDKPYMQKYGKLELSRCDSSKPTATPLNDECTQKQTDTRRENSKVQKCEILPTTRIVKVTTLGTPTGSIPCQVCLLGGFSLLLTRVGCLRDENVTA